MGLMIVTVIIPTRIRPKMMLKCLGSLWKTTKDYEVETVVIVDNDPQTYEALLNQPITKLIYNEEHLGAIPSWNKGLAVAEGDMFHPSNDDVLYRSGWLKHALKVHRERLDGYGFIALNSRIHDLDVQSGGMLFDRKFCKDHLGGVMFCPYYRHLFADKEVDLRAKVAGRFQPCYKAVAFHMHPCERRRPVDANDIWRDKFWPYDEAIFNVRQNNGFPDDFEAVI